MKTSEKDFRIFKEEFVKWQKRLGLQGYDARFELKRDDQSYASITIDEQGKTALVVFSKFIEEKDKAWHDPKAHAKHEAIHLLTHRIVCLAKQRYVRFDEINQEWEKLAVILEKVVR